MGSRNLNTFRFVSVMKNHPLLIIWLSVSQDPLGILQPCSGVASPSLHQGEAHGKPPFIGGEIHPINGAITPINTVITPVSHVFFGHLYGFIISIYNYMIRPDLSKSLRGLRVFSLSEKQLLNVGFLNAMHSHLGFITKRWIHVNPMEKVVHPKGNKLPLDPKTIKTYGFRSSIYGT